jgi:hypothetical protein
MGKAAEAIVAELHGKWYTACYRGKVFHGATAITGTILTVQTTTTATFLLYNPLGSGVNVEMIATDVGLLGTTSAVIGTILATLGVGTPGTVTQITATVNQGLFTGQSNANQAKLASAATITAATFFVPLFNVTSTTAAAVGNLHYDWDGKLVLPPGSYINLSSSPAQTVVSLNSYDWAEWAI